MPVTPEQLAQVDSFASLATLFYEELGWPAEKWNTFEGVADLYGIDQAEIPGVVGLQAVQKLKDSQTWGIFLVDFGHGELKRNGLRRIVNVVAEKARQRHDNPTWPHEDILFVCRSRVATWTFGHYTGEKPSTAKLKTFGWSDPKEARTACENLGKLAWACQDHWEDAWNVERLSETFFQELNVCFQEIEGLWRDPFTADDRRTATQLLINRLLFVCFLQEKQWLELSGSRAEYIFRLFEQTDTSDADGLGFSKKLELLFFSGLNSPNAVPGDRFLLEGQIGRVPFLNGGLFERTSLDSQLLPNKAYARLLGPASLFRSYNFTIEESTPLDVSVAIDPEMLGKIFEELVTQDRRHRTGSYYTPRPIVSFMCREALKGYLGGYENLVDEHDVAGVTVTEARALLGKLEKVRVCDPACGSGAYLVGMLQEIFSIQLLLDTRIHSARTDYQRKRIIIENCLYGVDLEKFAVTIAWLRLWLALVIDHDVNPLDDPLADVALPNLELKIETGDSLSGSNPHEAIVQVVKKDGKQAGLDFEGVDVLVRRYVEIRAQYAASHGPAKRELDAKRKELRAAIKGRVNSTGFSKDAFLWAVEFPEVFLSEHEDFVKGFDIVIANPPYVRQEGIAQNMGAEYKTKLVANFPNTGSGTADLFIYFYDRGLQLLRPGGMFVYISSNKWFKAGYGSKLRKHIATTSTIHSITDFGDLPVFKSALAYAMIFIASRAKPVAGQTPTFTTVESLGPPYPNLKAVIGDAGAKLPGDSIQNENWTLADSETLRRLRIMHTRGTPLGEFVKGQIFYGIKTGLNGAFVIDGATRQRLIESDPNSAEIIKPLIVGRDIRRWHIQLRDRWLLFTRRGTEIERYPAIKKYLTQFRSSLEPKPKGWKPKNVNDKWKGRKAGRYKWFEIQDDIAYYREFEKARIVYPDMSQEPRYALAEAGTMLANTAYMICCEDLALLAVLNSAPFNDQLASMLNRNQGDTQRAFSAVFTRALIPRMTGVDRDRLESLAAQILGAKNLDAGADVSAIEGEINRRVEFLYFFQVGDESFDHWDARVRAEAATEVGSLRSLMKGGEGDRAEFKSSIIWDVKQNKHNLVMRDEVLKEACAFLNADGGTILCGVDDDGNLLGLEKDIKHAGNKDKLSLVITNSLGELLKPHPVELVKMKFIDIDGETILRIDVTGDPKNRYESPSTKKEDAGKNIPKTHVRIHASAKALEAGDLINWWNRRSGGS